MGQRTIVGRASGGAEGALRPGDGRGRARYGGRAPVVAAVIAPVALLTGAGIGAGMAAWRAAEVAPATAAADADMSVVASAVRPMASYGGTLEGRLRRLLRDSEESGEARVSRAELGQMLEWCRREREERCGPAHGSVPRSGLSPL